MSQITIGARICERLHAEITIDILIRLIKQNTAAGDFEM